MEHQDNRESWSHKQETLFVPSEEAEIRPGAESNEDADPGYQISMQPVRNHPETSYQELKNEKVAQLEA